MRETEIKKLSEVYQLINDKYCILAEVLIQSGRLTLETINGNKEFIFKCSKPEDVYAIGTLIRDAADLVRSK